MAAKLIVRKKEYQVEAGKTIGEAIREIGLDPESYLAVRNGEMAEGTVVLEEGDVVKLVGVISGGR